MLYSLILNIILLNLGVFTGMIQSAFAETESSLMHAQTFTLGPVHIDKPYVAMTGPIVRDNVRIGNENAENEVWIKSFRVDITNQDNQPESLEYLCHAWASVLSNKDVVLLTISQGMEEMDFPDGYGIPVQTAGINTTVMAQVLNDDKLTLKDLQYKMSFNYIDGKDAQRLELKSLHHVDIFINKKDVKTPLSDNSHDQLHGTSTQEHSSDLHQSHQIHQGHMQSDDSMSHEDETLFFIPPGMHEYRTTINIALDGTIHMIKMHMHAYGESLSLLDKTSGQVVWKGLGETSKEKAVLTKSDGYSNSTGLKLYPTHKYELVTVYNNTTNHPVDAMAVLRMYVSSE